jgi:hypothetical protein
MAVFFTSLLPQFASHGSFVALFALGFRVLHVDAHMAQRLRAGGLARHRADASLAPVARD